MSLAPQARLVRRLRSMVFLGLGYERVADDVYAWSGQRPGPSWHVHGWTEARPMVAVGDGHLRPVTIRKRRWLTTVEGASPRTVHDRPPDATAGRYDLLVVVAALWCWLDGLVGVHRAEHFRRGPAPRTLLRWHARARPNASDAHQRIREILIERSEPRPFERLFPGGVPPPGCRLRRGWRDLDRTSTLCRGLTMLFRGACALGTEPTTLLAGARGRGRHPRLTVLD